MTRGPMVIADATHVVVAYDAAKWAAVPANNGGNSPTWQWGQELLVGFTMGAFASPESLHQTVNAGPFVSWLARSCDGGESWELSAPTPYAGQVGTPTGTPDDVDCTGPGFQECTELLKKFNADGCSVMLGTATGWRAQDRDATQNPELHKMLLMADIISPWSVGRFGTLSGAKEHAKKYWEQDVVWAREHGIDYMPVIFPGFSWHNLTGKKLAQIPRLDGQFMWSQIVANKKAGADMIYIAMFDEVDEATAIFKCTDNPPTSDGVKFLTMEGLPSDFYLRLTGEAGKLLRDETPLVETVPVK